MKKYILVAVVTTIVAIASLAFAASSAGGFVSSGDQSAVAAISGVVMFLLSVYGKRRLNSIMSVGG